MLQPPCMFLTWNCCVVLWPSWTILHRPLLPLCLWTSFVLFYWFPNPLRFANSFSSFVLRSLCSAQVFSPLLLCFYLIIVSSSSLHRRRLFLPITSIPFLWIRSFIIIYLSWFVHLCLFVAESSSPAFSHNFFVSALSLLLFSSFSRHRLLFVFSLSPFLITVCSSSCFSRNPVVFILLSPILHQFYSSQYCDMGFILPFVHPNFSIAFFGGVFFVNALLPLFPGRQTLVSQSALLVLRPRFSVTHSFSHCLGRRVSGYLSSSQISSVVHLLISCCPKFSSSLLVALYCHHLSSPFLLVLLLATSPRHFSFPQFVATSRRHFSSPFLFNTSGRSFSWPFLHNIFLRNFSSPFFLATSCSQFPSSCLVALSRRRLSAPFLSPFLAEISVLNLSSPFFVVTSHRHLLSPSLSTISSRLFSSPFLWSFFVAIVRRRFLSPFLHRFVFVTTSL